jgi:hypothetical protein
MIKRLLLALCACVVMGLAMEIDLGGTRVRTEAQNQVSDADGRRLMILVMDSLSVEDAAQLPALQKLEKKGFSSVIEPCLERITYMCIKEALTGRSSFSLFGLFVNWGAAADPGDSLLRDAQSAGRKVAMVSAGDLAPFEGDLDNEERFEDAYGLAETRQALAFAKDHDLVVYHYIWHDTQAHHNPTGSEEYQHGLRAMNRIISRVMRGLPEDMDLMVVGDHGHGPTGLHVQGMDIPTYLVLSSPQVKAGSVEGRLPITVVRFLAGSVMGLHTDSMEWEPHWVGWLDTELSPQASALLEDPPEAVTRSFPITMVAWCGLLVGLASWIVGSRLTALAISVCLLTGFGFDAWLQNMHFPGERDRVFEIWWRVPLVAFVVGLAWKRSLWSAWAGTVLSGLFSMILLAPVLHHYGLLRNSTWIGLPLALAAALTLAWERGGLLFKEMDHPQRTQRLLQAIAALAAGGVAWWGWKIFTDFQIFNFEIVGYRQVGWMNYDPALALLSLAGLGIIMHFLIDRDEDIRRRIQWSMLAGVGVSGSLALPSMAYILPFLVMTSGLFMRGVWRSRLLSLGIFWSLPYLFAHENIMGMLGVVSGTVIGLLMLHQLRSKAPDEKTWRLIHHWGGGLMLVVGAYLSLAWSYGLSFSGIDYTFFMHWLPEEGRWHERLWWLIFVAMFIKVFIPLFLMVELCRSQAPLSMKIWVEHGARLGWLRCVGVLVFATAWVVHSGSGAAGLRLAGVVQDAFAWVALSTTLVLVAMGRREEESGEAEGPAEATAD